MRVLSRNNRFTHRPFNGQGASLYVGVGATSDAIVFRKMRVLGTQFIKGSGFTIGEGLRKCSFVAQTTDPTAQIDYTFPPEWNGNTVWIQVRTFWNDIENVHNFDPVKLEIGLTGEDETTIEAAGSIDRADKRDGGIYRLRTTYQPSSSGLQADTLLIRKTAGTGTLADVSTTITANRNYDFDTAALTDGGSYTFALIAKIGATEETLDTITFTADAAAPATPTILSLIAS